MDRGPKEAHRQTLDYHHRLKVYLKSYPCPVVLYRRLVEYLYQIGGLVLRYCQLFTLPIQNLCRLLFLSLKFFALHHQNRYHLLNVHPKCHQSCFPSLHPYQKNLRGPLLHQE